jgi:uncharacterized damage-inducible protein DinB
MTTNDEAIEMPERADLLESLTHHRSLLRQTVQGLTDDQAAQRPTASELCLGGIIKHVTRVERRWADFIVQGPESEGPADPAAIAAHAASFHLTGGDTLGELLDRYQEVADRTDDLVGSLPSLDADHPLPPAPWFEPGARWTARRVILHIIAETAQHAGHADIIRETLDGAKSMG